MFNPEAPPELQTARWFNSDPLTLAGLKGKVVVLAAFQTTCGGSVRHALPQLKRVFEQFSRDEVDVIGLHAPFDQRDEQTPGALKAFIAEHGWPFPIAIDKPNGKDLPKTFAAYELQGTPSVLLFDRQGRLRRYYLGEVGDMRLAAEIMALSIEEADAPRAMSIAIERKLAEALIDPEPHHHHDHDGNCCGGHDHHDHDHGHEHEHTHHHHHGEGGCGDPGCKEQH